ncbi:MAG TPA: outer membrane protein assembly factor BamD [Vicinamibacterales bacterium]|nr:outer membrane protein assembly factor BamD [Vicinamibacterales bacterium]
MKRLITLAALALTVGCTTATTRQTVPAGTQEPDKFLFDKGDAALKARKWVTAREYFKQVVETYTQSPYRPDAKLAVGDTYLEEGGADNLVLAANEYREFLQFYPTNKRADYAQFKLGMTHFKQMRAAERDQTETKDAIHEFQTFMARYSATSSLTPEVKTRLREAMDRLGAADFQVGLFYFRQKWYPGSIDRFSALLKSDPEYSSRGDVYFYLGESYVKIKGREAQALPYYEKLVTEFPKNEHLQNAQKRIAELKAQQASNEKKS